ncbi:O-acyltransferase like protein-like [Heteronotia binoei]|uniref:O-acyltransferase like protein-like n=1 Tax=Heteronotia binoei TaxID=13085 RepID=UPI00292CD2F5|nr:O-acyltransferase like protein-like [Heteronotia binoei]
MEAPLFKLLLLPLLPYTSAGNFSQGCWEDVATFLSDLNAAKPKAYAVRMYDSVGKFGSNIFSGNTDRLGSYSECVSAEAPSGRFRGQYCKLQVQQDSIDYDCGMCVPSSCSEEDVTELAILDNVLEWEDKVLKNPIYIYSQSGPFYLGVDTFFLISGLLSSRSLLNMLRRSEKEITFCITLKYLCNRLLRSKYALMTIGTFLFLATFTVTALLSSFYKLPVANPRDMRKTSTIMYFLEYYSKPYCRYGPFLVGILLGLFTYQQPGPVLRTRTQASLGWLCAMFSMFMVIALAYTLKASLDAYSPSMALYQAVHRTVWAAAVGWIVFACEEGFGGFINWFLSWSIWAVIAKISYACYLVHPMLIMLYNGLQETLTHYSDVNMFYLFLAHCLMTFLVGLALTVMVEMPLQGLKQPRLNRQAVPL